jgi:hypothetical protein
MTQQTYLRAAILIGYNAAIFGALILGVQAFQHKYVPVKGPCKSNFVDPDSEDSLFCCSESDGAPPCYLGMGLVSLVETFFVLFCFVLSCWNYMI